jgi:hypothetical protein
VDLIGEKNMAKFKVAVEWVMIADVVIEAETLEDAILQVEDIPDFPDGAIVDGSFEVNMEVTRELNRKVTKG